MPFARITLAAALALGALSAQAADPTAALDRSFVEYTGIGPIGNNNLHSTDFYWMFEGAGMYGKLLTPQQGAPLRLVVPWKYGFKSIKGIVRIELTDKQPVSTWEAAAANEYGFYANVNPAVDHPRWSQNTERRIGESGRRATHPFNGYADEVVLWCC